MRYVVAVGGVVLGLAIAAGAEAQSTFERGWIDVNFGVAAASEDAFSMRATGEIFDEPADFGADYSLPRGASFDFGGGFMITPIFGVGVSFSGTAHEDVTVLDARIPHPIFANTYATDEAEIDTMLQRIEGGVNLQAMIVAAQTDRFRFRVFGGPTYIRVEQDAVTDIRYDQAFVFLQRVNAIEITEFDHERIEGTGWGFHGGADASVFFNRISGVGGVAEGGPPHRTARPRGAGLVQAREGERQALECACPRRASGLAGPRGRGAALSRSRERPPALRRRHPGAGAAGHQPVDRRQPRDPGLGRSQ